MPASPAAAAARHFARGIEQRLLPIGREQEGQLEGRAEHGRVEIARRDGDSRPRAKRHIVEHAAVLAQRDFAVGAAVDVVEDHAAEGAGAPCPAGPRS